MSTSSPLLSLLHKIKTKFSEFRESWTRQGKLNRQLKFCTLPMVQRSKRAKDAQIYFGECKSIEEQLKMLRVMSEGPGA